MKKHNVCAVIVLYNPDKDRLIKVVESTNSMVDNIVIVNNGCSSDTEDYLQHILSDNPKVNCIPLKENMGLAFGINQGIKWAINNGNSHVLILDHDTVPQNNMVEILLETLEHLDSVGEKVASVGASYFDPRSGLMHPFGKGDTSLEPHIQVRYLQSSGSLTPISVLKELGLMDDFLFIHHIDQEWCLRALSKGFKSFGVNTAVMEHIVGDNTSRVWLGRWQKVHLHSPQRHYFSIRNSIVMCKRSYIPLAWKAEDLARSIFMFLFFSLTISPRLEHAKMMTKGLIDGLLASNSTVNKVEETTAI
jgi:rhamnosyltransferase